MIPVENHNYYALRLLLLTALAIFAAEALLMLLIESWAGELPLLVRVFLDASLLMLCVFPTLYLLVFQEMAAQIRQRCANEQELADLNRNLELLLEERTFREQRASQDLLAEIHQRARAELALGQTLKASRTDREHLSAIMSAVDDGVLVVDGEGQVRLINTAAERLLNSNAYDLLGQPLAAVLMQVVDSAAVDALLKAEGADAMLEFDWARDGGQAETLRLCPGSLVAWEGGAAAALFLRRASLG